MGCADKLDYFCDGVMKFEELFSGLISILT